MPCSARCHFAGIEFAGDLLRQRFDRKLREYMFSRLVRFSWPLLQRCNCGFEQTQQHLHGRGFARPIFSDEQGCLAAWLNGIDTAIEGAPVINFELGQPIT